MNKENKALDKKLKDNILSKMKKGESLYIVDLTSVSFLSENYIRTLAQHEDEYRKTPFLYLIFSYAANYTLDFANKNLNYEQKRKKGSWLIYKFNY